MKHQLLGSLILILVTMNLQTVQAASKLDFLTSNIDTGTSPRTDFFQYANGAWIKKNPIPASESSWGIGKLVQEELYLRILSINKAAQKSKNEPGSISQKIGDFWATSMDTRAINHTGLRPLQGELSKIDEVKTYQDLVGIAADFHNEEIGLFFDGYAAQDSKASDHNIYQLDQGGLGLPNREYYFHTDERTKHVQEAYQKYMSETLVQLGLKKPAAESMTKAVYDLETKLAAGSKKMEDLRDPIENYHKMTLTELSLKAPNFDWKAFCQAVGVKALEDPVMVAQPEFFVVLSKELKDTSIDTWKNYLKFHLVFHYATALDDQTYNRYFNFQKALTGASTPRARWKRMIDMQEDSMGEALGQLFVKKYFDETAKKRYSDLAEALRTAYAERIRKLTWMGDATKTKALDKLAKVTKKVGYPDKWKDFSTLQIGKDSFLANVRASGVFRHQFNIGKLGKPVDRSEWMMSPQTYNAYYNPESNEIVLPAGMFTVPGMKDADLDDAFVYGYAAASTIGHEITHGFDDEGRLFDGAGNLNEWWTKEDSTEFGKRAQAIIEEFNEFVPVDNLHVNGASTQGENIADLGGLLLGVDAFKKSDIYREGKKVNGFTPMQRYFLGYAYSWMYEEKKEKLASQLMSDFHAPAKERVNGSVVNIPEFYEAFGVKKGDKMYRDEAKRVSIW